MLRSVDGGWGVREVRQLLLSYGTSATDLDPLYRAMRLVLCLHRQMVDGVTLSLSLSLSAHVFCTWYRGTRPGIRTG